MQKVKNCSYHCTLIFKFSNEMSCDWYNNNDEAMDGCGGSDHCTSTAVRRWSFIIAENLCQKFGIHLIKGRHIPQESDDNPHHTDGADQEWDTLPGLAIRPPVASLGMCSNTDIRYRDEEKEMDLPNFQQLFIDNGSQDWSLLLPIEIVLKMFKFMKPVDILAVSQTCQVWRSLGEDDKLWEQICKDAGLAYCLNLADLKMVKRHNEDSNLVHSAWKVNFLKKFKIERKFRQGFPQVLTVESDWNSVGTMEFFNDKIVYKYMGTFYVFSSLTGDLLHELVGPICEVSTFRLNEHFLVTGTYNGLLKVWNLDTGSYLHTMLGHTAHVICLDMHANIAVTGSHDNTVRVWDVQQGSCITILSGHIAFVRCVQFDGRRVISGSEDKTIKVWDHETGVCLRTMNHDSHIAYLKFNGVEVVAGFIGGAIKVWDVDTGVYRHNLEANMSMYMELQGDVVVCRSWDDLGKTAEIWSMSTGVRLYTLGGPQQHSCYITGILVNENFVVTCSHNERLVKLWDIKTGEFIRDMVVLEEEEFVRKMRMKDARIVLDVFSKTSKRSKLRVLNFDTNDQDYEVNLG